MMISMTTENIEILTPYVFVYGTLKQNKGNHNCMLAAKGKFIGKAITKNKYSLYVSGIPYVLKHNPLYKIHGELFKVKNFKPLDSLEGHPHVYRREIIDVICNNKQYKAYIYFFTRKLPIELQASEGIF